ncbi:MAG: spore maturation protein [Gammaproteobacteria bacterium]|nr:spore maturation protein [Gammaproteobacteria bacterium]
MNVVFFLLVAVAFVTAAWQQLGDYSGEVSPMDALSKAMVDSASGAVELALGLVGVMALFLGLMKIAEKGGLLTILARLIRPLMVRLFPEVPADHPAMGAMILNFSANILGLGNAATPFGIKAMQELNRLNPRQGTATDSMVLFLAINTSSITLLPTGVIALRAAAGSANPAGILPTTLFATVCSTVVAIMAALAYRRFFPLPNGAVEEMGEAADQSQEVGQDSEAYPGYPPWVSWSVLLGFLVLIPLTVVYGERLSPWILPGIMMGFLVFGLSRNVAIYESFIEGAKEGFEVALKIIPYLVAILVAVGMFRASGAMNWLVSGLGAMTAPLGLPAEALPMALLRPLSGSGAYGVMASIINDPAIGPDSYVGYLVSTLQGTTETTFYVLAVYFGAVQVKRIRHALAAGLTADLAGVIAAVVAVAFLYG